MMSKKDYETFADIFHKHYEGDLTTTEYDLFAHLLNDLVKYFKEDNPKFDKFLFYDRVLGGKKEKNQMELGI